MSFGQHACLVWELKQGSFNVAWVHLMIMHFGTQGGTMLSNTGSPPRLSAQGAQLLGKTGPHIGYTKIFWVLDVDILFVCFVNKTHQHQLKVLLSL